MRSVRGAASFAVRSAIVLLVTALLAELVVRAVAPQQLIEVDGPPVLRPDPVFGWRHQENVDTRVNTGEGMRRIVTDARGYRVAPSAPARSASRRVLALGDSFVEALQVDHRQTLTAVLEQSLSSDCGASVVVDNAGVSAWEPDHYLLEAARARDRERYDLAVVFLLMANDVVSERRSSFSSSILEPARVRWPRSLDRRELMAAVLEPINDELNGRSHLFLLVKSRIQGTLTRLGLSRIALPEVYLRSERRSPRWDVTTQAAVEIRDALARDGTPVLFVLLPVSYQVQEDVTDFYLRSLGIDPATVDLAQPNEILASSMAARGLDTLDALPDLRARAASGARLYGEVDRHFSPAGHLATAEIVAPRVRAMLCGR